MDPSEGRPRTPEPAEPLPWFGGGRNGPHRFGALRRPKDAVIAGLLVLVLGIGTLVSGLNGGHSSRGSSVSDALGSWGDVVALFICAVVSGLGAFLFVVGVVRHPWYRRYRRTHGRPPF
ncbi:hypothetical protein E6P78_02485 [Streptomyces sp. A0958]|uniref:hypothetical protein n=1 Tax=Streptomyces sp. A0958 TaxID=2563101 RepID=UPI00109E540A|nr:hypothetical protein [Streptomyces sp. A0958]THA72169.1 hypothetical protein E6P78_02485 [Streptomyces sp. A0958]